MNQKPDWPCLAAWVTPDPIRICSIATSPQPDHHKVLAPLPADPVVLQKLHSDLQASMFTVYDTTDPMLLEQKIDEQLRRMPQWKLQRLTRQGSWPSIQFWFANEGRKLRVSLLQFDDDAIPRRIPLPANAIAVYDLWRDIAWAIGFVTGKVHVPEAVKALDREPRRRGHIGAYLSRLPRYVDVDPKDSDRDVLISKFPEMPSEGMFTGPPAGQPGTGKRQ